MCHLAPPVWLHLIDCLRKVVEHPGGFYSLGIQNDGLNGQPQSVPLWEKADHLLGSRVPMAVQVVQYHQDPGRKWISGTPPIVGTIPDLSTPREPCFNPVFQFFHVLFPDCTTNGAFQARPGIRHSHHDVFGASH